MNHILSNEKIQKYQNLCHRFRIDAVKLIHKLQTGHTGGSLSECEILTMLYMECANITPENQDSSDRDIIVLSKGHGAPILYMCLAEKGFFPKEELQTLRQLGSRLQGHPNMAKTPGVELSTGPLGLGLSAGVGMCCAKMINNNDGYVFVVTGDGELDEGTIWEAAMSASKFKCERLITIVDWNKVQLDGLSRDVMPIGDLKGKWSSFGWNVIECDGHNVAELYDSIETAKETKNGRPTVILANTVKGKGVSFMENTNKFHGKAITDEEFEAAMKELEA